jgi:hypothetical protein
MRRFNCPRYAITCSQIGAARVYVVSRTAHPELAPWSDRSRRPWREQFRFVLTHDVRLSRVHVAATGHEPAELQDRPK